MVCYRAANWSVPVTVHTTIPWTRSVAVIAHPVRREPRSVGGKGMSSINDKSTHRDKVNRMKSREQGTVIIAHKSGETTRTFVPDCWRPLRRVPCAFGIDSLQTKELPQRVWFPRV